MLEDTSISWAWLIFQMLKGSRVWSCLKRRFPASSRGARVSVDLLMCVSAPASLTLHLPYPLKCPCQTHINIVILQMKEQEFGNIRHTTRNLSPSSTDMCEADARAS